MTRRTFGLISLLLVVLAAVQARGQCLEWNNDPGRDSPGPSGITTVTMVWDRDGPGGQPSGLLAGGVFEVAGGVPAKNVAFWNGTSWSAMGAGFNGEVIAFAVFNSELYAAGAFTASGITTCNRIARWDAAQQAWLPVGAGLNGTVRSLSVYNSRLYAGGGFTTAGGASALGIASWTGSSWFAAGGGLANANGTVAVLAMIEFNGFLYVGGRFTHAGGLGSDNLARWNGSTWTAVGANNTVNALTKYVSEVVGQSSLYVAGYFTIVSNVTTGPVARLNGSTWSAVGTVPGTGATTLFIRYTGLSSFELYASVSGPTFGVYRFASGAWNLHGEPTFSNSLALYGGQIVIGRGDGVRRWDGTHWRPYGNGIAGSVNAAASWNGSLYLAGAFPFADQQVVNNIVRWDGTSFSPLGLGTNNTIYSLAVYQNHLFAAGQFNLAGGLAAVGTARWNGSVWQPISGGPAYSESMIVASDGNLYIGGGANGGSSYVWRWNGFGWQQVGGNVPTGADHIAWWNGTLYASGTHVSRLDGATWNMISSGFSDTAGLVPFGGELLRLWLSGGGQIAVLAWNGTSWRSLLPAIAGTAGAIHVQDGQLLVAIENDIYRWTGAAWLPVESTNGTIDAMGAHNGELLALGRFSMAGDGVSRAWASLSPCCGSADFDNDGDAGTDADIEAFFACLGGACCPTCGTSDFDQDGDAGTDADIEAFFRVLGGGTC
jgi:hypothetical protein